MLLEIVRRLPILLLVVGFLLLAVSLVLRLARKDKLTPRARGHVFFWGSVGFWALVIGAFMSLEQLWE